MIQYVIRRVLSAVPVFLAIITVTFALARAVPGDPCRAILGEKATEATCQQFIRDFGLDKPIPVQFGIYMGNLMHGDVGNSIRFGRPVSIILIERLPTTIELSVFAMTLAILVGTAAGIVSAIRRNSFADLITMVGANIGVSMPVFFLGLLLIYVFAVFIKRGLTNQFGAIPPYLEFLVFPPSGRLTAGLSAKPFYEVFGWPVEDGSLRFHFYEFLANMYIFNSIITRNWEVLKDVVEHLVLPAVALSTIPMSVIARMTRSSMLEILGLDFVRTARAKGLPKRQVIMKHAFRNALLPVVTIAGLQLGGVLSGAVLTESIFGLAGVGLSMFEAITARDFPIVQGLVIVIAAIYILFNLLVDLSYAFLDPRIRLN
jgi:peptide/nickel transport system permease protein